ncbi:TRAP transporter substrate-binding protein DctP [Marinomonas algicola]|uniref:TRAP transporter substrate-binding protein DctP n=1 Tax=Marinomonas algicola TaxID=2773454 RepID=UPI00174C84E2|nr:TRAP transporter substrate-binding protein DctP [Marinomonas algicola]
MFLRSIKLAAVSVAIASSTSVLQAKELIFNNFFPPSHFIHGVMNEWISDVAEATDGRVTFIVPAGTLAPPPQQLSAVKSGIADVAMTANIFIQKQVPVLSYSSLPFLVSNAEAASVANWRTYEKFLANKAPLKKYGVEMLSVFNYSGGNLYGLEDKPIETIEELKSKRLWALPGYTANNIKNIGVSPVTGPAVKVSEVVSKGVVDAFYGISYESVTDFKASPYTKNIVQFPFAGTSTSFSLFINKRTWSKISEEDQMLIKQLSGEALSRKVGKAAANASLVALTAMELSGIKVIPGSQDLYQGLQHAAKPLFTDFVKKADKIGVNGNEMLNFFKSENAKETNNLSE